MVCQLDRDDLMECRRSSGYSESGWLLYFVLFLPNYYLYCIYKSVSAQWFGHFGNPFLKELIFVHTHIFWQLSRLLCSPIMKVKVRKQSFPFLMKKKVFDGHGVCRVRSCYLSFLASQAPAHPRIVPLLSSTLSRSWEGTDISSLSIVLWADNLLFANRLATRLF